LVFGDDAGMHNAPAPSLTRSSAEADPEALLAEVIASGWPRLIVPRALGGEGATAAQAAEALLHLAKRHPAAAWIAWSHGLVIEALLRAPNVAVRETVLPDMLDGTRGGAVSWVSDFGLTAAPKPVHAEPLDRGWYLHGQLDQVLNLQWAGYVVLCPVWFADPYGRAPRLGWTLLRNEEDGLHHEMDRSRALSRQAACGNVRLKRVYFREDELLADDADALSAPLSVLDQTLRAALWSGIAALK
jgi:alkylation response protein AidB-like acyl-CoA dehydrogenase